MHSSPQHPDTASSLGLDIRWLFDSAPDAMVVVDEAGRIVLANPQVERLFGYSRDELVGRPVETLIPERLRGAHVQHRDHYSRQPRSRPMGVGLVLYGLRRDGAEFPVEISLSAMRTEAGLLSLAAIRDVTERRNAEQELQRHRNHLEELVAERTAALEEEVAARKRIEERHVRLLTELEAANEELQRFAYVVSHDLKAPLRAIDSLANWIAEDYGDRLDQAGREQIATLLARVQRMNALIDGILRYSRLGRVREEKTVVDLGEALQEAVALLSPSARLGINVHDRLPQVCVERTRIIQVFENLLSNAIRHNDQQEPRIDIHCVEERGAWQVTVADNGPGIDPKHFDKVFEMFQTLQPRDRVESTGIGLTMVKRIIENAGGRIWVESPAQGGAAFHFTLPLNPGGESCGRS